MDRKHCDWCDELLLEAKTINPASPSGALNRYTATTCEAVNEIAVSSPFPSEMLSDKHVEASLVLCTPCNAKFWLFLEVRGNVPLMTEEAIAKRVEETNGGS